MTRDKLEALIWQQLAAAGCLPDTTVIDTILDAADQYRACRLHGNAKKADDARTAAMADA